MDDEEAVPLQFSPTPKIVYVKKGKTIQLQALTGLDGSRSLRLPDFKTIVT
jgi:hypothetical protein